MKKLLLPVVILFPIQSSTVKLIRSLFPDIDEKLPSAVDISELRADMETPDPVAILRGSDSPVTCVIFIGHEYLISGSQSGTLYKWSLKTWRVVSKTSAHNGQSVLWLHDLHNNSVISQGRDGLVAVWDTSEDWQRLKSFHCSALGFCNSVYFRMDADRMIAVPSDKTSEIRILDIDKSHVALTLRSDETEKRGMCMCMKLASETEAPSSPSSPSSSSSSSSPSPRLLVGYESGEMILWDVKSALPLSRLRVHEESVMCVDFLHSASSCSLAFSGSVDTKLRAWAVEGDTLTLRTSAEITNKGLNDVAVRGDGRILATAGWDAAVRVFTARRLRPLAVLAFHKESVQTLCFSSAAESLPWLLAAGSKDKTISLWSVYQKSNPSLA